LLDLVIVCVYFLILLGVGLWVSRSLKNFDDFSIGTRNYGAFFVFATLSASFIGGGFTLGLAEKVFSLGLVYAIVLLGFSLKEILVATIIAPRMGPFRDARSVGDIIGRLYGPSAKILTGIASGLVCAGIAGAQFAAFGYILQVLTGIEPVYGILLGAALVIAYDSLGGMKSVVINDVIHFVVLSVTFPCILYFGLKQIGGLSQLIISVPSSHLNILDSMPLLTIAGMFLSFFFGETLVPPYVQRLLIGKSVSVTARGTLWSGLLSIPFFFLVAIIGLIALVLEPGLEPNLALPYVINTVMPVGLKGLAIAGMLAVVMSSADSFLNAAAVSVTHDVIKPLKKKIISKKTELLYARVFTCIIGLIGVVFALLSSSALDILLAAYNFWTPFILVPLVGGILGYKASTKIFWISCIMGIISSYFLGAVIGIGFNLACFVLGRSFQSYFSNKLT
jgi:SSS family solute:Na+ symporter